MRFEPTRIQDVVVVEPDVHRDDRGFFLETWHERKYREAGIPGPFVQDNHSRSRQSALRGLHAQREHPQGKLVRCIEGRVWDVAVDVRLGSPTFACWVGVELSAETFRQLWVPPGFVHGFCVLSEMAQIEYKCTDFYTPGDELGVRWDDPRIGVDWPVREPLLSAKDAGLPRLDEVLDRLPRWEGTP